MNVWASRWRLLGLVLLGILAVFLASCVSYGSDTTPTPDPTRPEAVVERFFHWYASERNLGRNPMAPGSLEANADVTREFVSSMAAAAAAAQPGVDPMLCSGSIPHAFTVGKAEVSGDSASVTVGAESHPAAWRVGLRREASSWRITALKCVVP
jgi:hypothetical protein